MKLALAATLALMTSFASATPDLVQKMLGKYVTDDANCAYDTASLKTSRISNKKILQVTLTNSTTGSFNVQSVDLDNLWTRVKTTRGIQRIIKQDRIQGQSLVSEEKKCLPGWFSCDDWSMKAIVTLLDEDTVEARLSENESACTYRRVTQ